MGVGRCQLESQVFQRPPKKIQTVHPLTSSWVTVSLPDSCDLLSDAVTQPGLEHLARPGLRCCISLLKIKKKNEREKKKKVYHTSSPWRRLLSPLFLFPAWHPLKRSSVFPSTLFLPFPPRSSSFLRGAPTQSPSFGVLLLFCSLGDRPVNHRRLGAPARPLSASQALGVPGAPVSAALCYAQSRSDLSAEPARGGAAPAAGARVTGD